MLRKAYISVSFIVVGFTSFATSLQSQAWAQQAMINNRSLRIEEPPISRYHGRDTVETYKENVYCNSMDQKDQMEYSEYKT